MILVFCGGLWFLESVITFLIIFKGLKIFKVDAQKIKGGPDLKLLKKCLVLIFILRSGKKAPHDRKKSACRREKKSRDKR